MSTNNREQTSHLHRDVDIYGRGLLRRSRVVGDDLQHDLASQSGVQLLVVQGLLQCDLPAHRVDGEVGLQAWRDPVDPVVHHAVRRRRLVVVNGLR